MSAKKHTLLAQRQERQTGIEAEMHPAPDFRPRFPGSGRLKDRVALISGGDSGIGRAVAIAMAREVAKVMILYLDEHVDTRETAYIIREDKRAQAEIFATASRQTEQGGELLRVPRRREGLLHVGPGAAPQWRRDHRCLRAGTSCSPQGFLA